MNPKTPLQKEVARLSKRLPRPTAAQKAYAFRHCFKHYGIKRADGTIICTECGHSWKSEQDLVDILCGCTCPHCGMELEVKRTRNRVFDCGDYFSIVTTCRQYQVIRFFWVKSRYKAGEAADYSICEVVQRWIAPDGKVVTVARLRGMSILYYDLWAETSDMEVRKRNDLKAYDITPQCTYPKRRIIPEIIRNGYKGDCDGIPPYDLFKSILTDCRAETLLKAGQCPLLRHYLLSSCNMERYWASVKICIRNGYTIPDGSIWCDTIDLLRHFDKDLNCPKYVCPAEVREEHDRLAEKKRRQEERELLAERIRKAVEHEEEYRKQKECFFGIAFTDGTLQVRVLESVAEFAAEGTAMHHCVFSGEYYKKKDSLVLSATINGKRIETVEVSLVTFKVVQSRGVNNSNTECHNRIINLVENNINLIRQRMKAA